MKQIAMMIGADLWYFHAGFQPREQPRTAKIVGPGDTPGTVNVMVFSDPLADSRAPASMTRRNVPLFDRHPERFHVEMQEFVVWPASQVDHPSDWVKAHAAYVTILDAPEPTGTEEQPAGQEEWPPKADPSTLEGAQDPPGEPADEEDEDDQPAKITVGALNHFMRSPMVERMTEPALEAGVTFREEGGKLLFTSANGRELAQVVYREKKVGTNPKGYSLRAWAKRKTPQVVSAGAVAGDEVRELTKLLVGIIEAGAEAKTLSDAKKATEQAMLNVNPVE